jgi:quercetin dioxygenase-like cupin family protein
MASRIVLPEQLGYNLNASILIRSGSRTYNTNMTTYTFVEDVEAAVRVPDNGVLSRTLFSDEALKIVAFRFSAGQELSSHSAPMATVLHFLKGEAELTLSSEKRNVREGALVHMAPGLPHGIIAKTHLSRSRPSFPPQTTRQV